MLSVAAAADEVSPDTLSIVQTNVFAKRTHLLTRRSTRGMQVTLYPDFSDRGVTVWIVVQPDSVVLRPEKQSVNAFGLGDAQFTVSLSSGVAPGDSVPVTLDADGGTIRDAMVVYPKGAGSATARVHFEGLGTHRVTARAGVLTMAEATVHVTFPYALLFGAVLGALAGSFLFALKDRDRPDTKAIWWVLLSGVITGVLVAAIAAIGAFKLGGLSLPQGGGALASFVAGALGGFSGPKLLSKFAGGDDGGTKKAPG